MVNIKSDLSLGHKPKTEKWEFDESVANCFDDMLKRSIPQYEEMRKMVIALGEKFVLPDTDIVDLGCSRGEGLLPFIGRFGRQNRYVGIDNSDAMIDIARQRFDSLIQCHMVNIAKADLRNSYPFVKASLTLAVLTMQFIPIEYRQHVFKNIYKSTVQGGAFIFIEKILGGTPVIDKAMTDLYYAMKLQNGYTQDEINIKKSSLEGVLVPCFASWNEKLLTSAGFNQIDCFWRWMNFAGWIAVKDN